MGTENGQYKGKLCIHKVLQNLIAKNQNQKNMIDDF